MELEGILRTEVSQRKANIVQSHSHVESQQNKPERGEEIRPVAGSSGGQQQGQQEEGGQRHNPPAAGGTGGALHPCSQLGGSHHDTHRKEGC